MKRMLSRVGVAIACAGSLTACGSPAMSSAMRPNFPPDWHLEGYCTTVGRGSIDNEVKARYQQGWRLAYISEYTSTARFGNPSVVCFERPTEGAAH